MNSSPVAAQIVRHEPGLILLSNCHHKHGSWQVLLVATPVSKMTQFLGVTRLPRYQLHSWSNFSFPPPQFAMTFIEGDVDMWSSRDNTKDTGSTSNLTGVSTGTSHCLLKLMIQFRRALPTVTCLATRLSCVLPGQLTRPAISERFPLLLMLADHSY